MSDFSPAPIPPYTTGVSNYYPVIDVPVASGLSSVDIANIQAAVVRASAAVIAGGNPLINFQSCPYNGTTLTPYNINGYAIPIVAGTAYVGVLPVQQQINQSTGYVPDGPWNFIGGTIFDAGGANAGMSANTTPAGSITFPAFAVSQISGVRLWGLGFQKVTTGIAVGATNVMGLVWSEVDEIYVQNASVWGVNFQNYQHVTFGKIETSNTSQGSGQYYASTLPSATLSPGNSTFRDLFAIANTNTARGIVFEADGVNAALTVGTVESIQVNGNDRTVITQTATFNSTSTVAVTDGTQFLPRMPVTFNTTVAGFTAGLTYIVQTVSGNNITLGDYYNGTVITATASTTSTITASGFAGIETTATGAVYGDFLNVDVEGNLAVGIYVETGVRQRWHIQNSAGTTAGFVARNTYDTSIYSDSEDLTTDFFIAQGHFFGQRSTILQYPLSGLWTDSSRGNAGALSISQGQETRGGGDLEARTTATGFLYPVAGGIAEHITAVSASLGLSGYQCGLVVLVPGSPASLTFTLPTIVTQYTNPQNSNIGEWHEIWNLSSNALTLTTSSSQLFNGIAGLTSVTIQPGSGVMVTAGEESTH
jgi:hypothetical protein